MTDASGSGLGGFMPKMFADVMKMMTAQDPTHFGLVVQLAQSVVSDAPSGNVEPKDRIANEELVRIAERHVADVMGMSINPSGNPIEIAALSPAAWLQSSLVRWRPLLEAVIAAHALPVPPGTGLVPEDVGEDDAEMAKLMEGWLGLIAPTLVAMQIGSSLGHLARRALGQHDLVLPGSFGDEVAIVVANRARFAEDWSLPEHDVVLWASARDLAVHAAISRPHVAKRLSELVVAAATGAEIDQAAIQRSFEDLDPSSMADLTSLLGVARAVSSERNETPEHRELVTLVTVLHGYADWVTRTVADRVIGARSAISEAIARARMERSDDERAVDLLVGVDQGPELYERGRHFVDGVLARNGERDLARLWTVESNLPTPAELEAPGLWLERINLSG